MLYTNEIDLSPKRKRASSNEAKVNRAAKIALRVAWGPARQRLQKDYVAKLANRTEILANDLNWLAEESKNDGHNPELLRHRIHDVIGRKD